MADSNTFAAPVDLAAFTRQTAEAPRHYATDAPTIAPPASEQEVTVGGAEIDPLDLEIDFDNSETSQRVTITNEVELETARLQSVVLSSLPPALTTPSPRELPSGEHILSMANAQAPTVPPPKDYDSERMAAAATAPRAAPLPRLSDAASPHHDVPPVRAKLSSESPTGVHHISDPVVEMRDRENLGDYTGALSIAEAVLSGDPSNEEALHCAERSRAVLVKMYSAKIGSLERVPVVMVPRHQLRWLSIDHRAGFVLSHIDGTSSLEMILDVSGMAPLDALRILYELIQQRIISFR